MRKKKKKKIYFHGGPLGEGDTFAGKTFWTDFFGRAYEYAGRDDFELWAVLIDEDQEVFAYEDDRGYTWDMDADASWGEQTRQIEAAFAKGATVFCAEDGWALDHRGRRVRRLPPAFCHAVFGRMGY